MNIIKKNERKREREREKDVEKDENRNGWIEMKVDGGWGMDEEEGRGEVWGGGM